MKAQGVGRLSSTNPLFIYEGQFGADGQPNGFGRYIDEGVSYTGGWSKGVPHGTGRYIVNKLKANDYQVNNCSVDNCTSAYQINNPPKSEGK